MTGFFHVPSAFGVLEEKVIPALFEGKSSKDHLRVWVAGCATGEEAYSVAILLFQYASTLGSPPSIEVYATDNDEEALETARIGIYPQSIAHDMSDVCLATYFAEHEDGYAVSSSVKSAVLFSSHDVLIDNSFQSFELITCRFLLGYLDETSQSQVLAFFHHSLKPDGFLFLGMTELDTELPDQFVPINTPHHVYRLIELDDTGGGEKVGSPFQEAEDSYQALTSRERTRPGVESKRERNGFVSEQISMASSSALVAGKGSNGIHVDTHEDHSPQVQSIRVGERKSIPEYRRKLFADHVPASVVIDPNYAILDYTDRLTRLFVPATSDLEKDYLSTLSDSDRFRLEEAINLAFTEKNALATATVPLQGIDHGIAGSVIDVQYLTDHHERHDYVSLVFKDAPDDTTELQRDLHDDSFKELLSANSGDQFLFEESFWRVIATAPFPILVHAEGGAIVEQSPAWHSMAGISKEDAPTITEWTHLAKGQRLRLKDSKLKNEYDAKGVVCISIRTLHGDTKLLAFHSHFLGKDSHGRKLTLTMAVDITNYPGNSGMGIAPESADFGVATKKAFLANMSHEIRTPLTSMIGFADYLADKLSENDVQFAHYISESGNRLLETLNAVLRASSMDGLDLTLYPEMLDITDEIEGLLRLFKPHAEQYGIAIKMVVEESVKVRQDRAAFRRIMANLIGNALKFTQEGEVVINVNSDESAVIVSVRDTGVGIAEDFLPYIFDRFAQEAKGQSRSYSGCGLGLSICRELVETLGGAIHVETEVEVGSTFTVRLPKVLDVPDRRHTLSRRIHLEPAGVRDYEPNILLVEDNVDTQELLLLILQDSYHVTLTSNAAETLQIAQHQTFDAILMDLNLGGRSTGFDLLKELRTIPAYEDTPVLAVSALPLDVIRKQLIREGFSGYIAKPFTKARILDALEALLGSEPS